MSLPEILSVDEVAALLGCEPLTVQVAAGAGDLPGLKIGRPWVFPREALLSALNAKALAEAQARATPKKPAAVKVPGRRRTTPVALPQGN